MIDYPAIPANVQHSTWLGSARAASGGRNEARAERPGADIASLSFSWVIFY